MLIKLVCQVVMIDIDFLIEKNIHGQNSPK